MASNGRSPRARAKIARRDERLDRVLVTAARAWNDAVLFARCWEEDAQSAERAGAGAGVSRERYMETTQLGKAFERRQCFRDRRRTHRHWRDAGAWTRVPDARTLRSGRHIAYPIAAGARLHRHRLRARTRTARLPPGLRSHSRLRGRAPGAAGPDRGPRNPPRSHARHRRHRGARHTATLDDLGPSRFAPTSRRCATKPWTQDVPHMSNGPLRVGIGGPGRLRQDHADRKAVQGDARAATPSPSSPTTSTPRRTR